MGKKGLAEIVAITAMILIVIAVVIILWNPVKEFLEDSSESSISTSEISINMEIKSANFDETEKNLTIVIKRNPNLLDEKINVTGAKISIEDQYISESYVFSPPGGFNELEEKRFDINFNESDLNTSDLKKASLFPIYIKNGKEIATQNPSSVYIFNYYIFSFSFNNPHSNISNAPVIVLGTNVMSFEN